MDYSLLLAIEKEKKDDCLNEHASLRSTVTLKDGDEVIDYVGELIA